MCKARGTARKSGKKKEHIEKMNWDKFTFLTDPSMSKVRNEIEEMLKNVPPKPKTKSQAKEEL